MSCGSALHPQAPLPSSETVFEPQFLNQENDDSGGYGFVGWCEDPTSTCMGKKHFIPGTGQMLNG